MYLWSSFPPFWNGRTALWSNTVCGAKCARRNGAAGRRGVFGSPLPCCGPWPTVGKELRRENAPLRAVLNGRLVSAPETLYDFFLFQEIAAQPEEFREEEVIGRVLGVTQMPISDEFLALRMEQLIRDGLLEAVTQPEPGKASYRRVLRKVTLK